MQLGEQALDLAPRARLTVLAMKISGSVEVTWLQSS
jgi:hypothetical protein